MSRTRNNRPEILAQCKHPLRVCNGIPPDFHPKQCISPAQRLFLREPRCLRIDDPDDRGHRHPETLSGPPGSGCELVNEQMFDCMIMQQNAWTSTTTQDTPPIEQKFATPPTVCPIRPDRTGVRRTNVRYDPIPVRCNYCMMQPSKIRHRNTPQRAGGGCGGRTPFTRMGLR